jgi:hypothetical protein
VPSGRLALVADEVSGQERRCLGATDDELAGLLRGWAAIESWASGAKLGVIAEMIRRDDAPRHGGCHGDLPDEWSPSLRHELAGALACSVQSAETTTWLAWEQQARLPGVRASLSNGTLTLPKARAIIETFKYLADGDAARAEALILDQLEGKTYTQVLRLAEQAALTVDPELAGRRREQAQKRDARVTIFRELSGTAGLSGRDLPPDEALAAMAGVNARAQEYEDSGSFGDTRMDALRAYAYLDLLKGTPAELRIACAEAQDEAAETAEAMAWADARAARATAQSGTGAEPEASAGQERRRPRTRALRISLTRAMTMTDPTITVPPTALVPAAPVPTVLAPALAAAAPSPGQTCPRRDGCCNCAHLTWSSPCSRCSAWPSGPARYRASACLTPRSPGTWPPPRPAARVPRFASPSPARRDTPSRTAAADQTAPRDGPRRSHLPEPAPPACPPG